MLERTLDLFTPVASPKVLPKMDTYLTTLAARRADIVARNAGAAGTTSPAVRLLHAVLTAADIPALLRMDNDLTAYTDGVLGSLDGLERLIDPSHGRIFQGCFLERTDTRATEYVVPTRTRNPLRDLPLDAGWTAWQAVRAVRLLDHDSPALTLHVHLGQIRFPEQPPTHAVIGVDVVALVLQRLAFCRDNPEGRRVSSAEYLSRYILNAGLLLDLERLWLCARYQAALAGGEDHAQTTAGEVGTNVWGRIGSSFAAAMEEVDHLVQRTASGAVSPIQLIDSLPLPGSSVLAYVAALQEAVEVPALRQYRWIEFIRDARWLKLIIAAHQLQPKLQPYLNLKRSLQRDLPLLLNTRFWESIHDVRTRLWVEQALREMIRTVESV